MTGGAVGSTEVGSQVQPQLDLLLPGVSGWEMWLVPCLPWEADLQPWEPPWRRLETPWLRAPGAAGVWALGTVVTRSEGTLGREGVGRAGRGSGCKRTPSA